VRRREIDDEDATDQSPVTDQCHRPIRLPQHRDPDHVGTDPQVLHETLESLPVMVTDLASRDFAGAALTTVPAAGIRRAGAVDQRNDPARHDDRPPVGVGQLDDLADADAPQVTR
jgi:hypothetical protein